MVTSSLSETLKVSFGFHSAKGPQRMPLAKCVFSHSCVIFQKGSKLQGKKMQNIV